MTLGGLRAGLGPAAGLRALTKAVVRTGVVLGVMVLGACATPPATIDTTPWTSGRLSVRVDASAERAASSLTADFDLRGDSRQGEMRLSTPLGTRIATARWSPQQASLDLGRGETRYADLDALSRDALGETLPLQALPDWLAGRPWPGADARTVPAGFEQLGWQVSLAGRAEGQVLAERLQPPPRVSVRVRLERTAS